MASRPHEVTFSTGLLEKLAGMKKPEPPKSVAPPRSPLQGVQLPARPGLSADAARLIAADKQLSRQLQATKEVAGLLLKHEVAEVHKVQEKADELLGKFSVHAKPAPCQAEAQACSDCFKEHTKEAWRCMQAAEAYERCSFQAFTAASSAAVSSATVLG